MGQTKKGRGGKGSRGRDNPKNLRSGGSSSSPPNMIHSSEHVKASDKHESNIKRCLNVLVMGHIGAGKSLALRQISRLENDRIALENTSQNFEELTMDENRQSEPLEDAMKKNEDELEGETVTLGGVKYETKTSTLHFFEAPSDHRYVSKMMSKAMQADIAVLFVSGSEDKDELEDDEKARQSQECVYMISTLGITKILVVVSKMDNHTWKKQSYNEIESVLTNLLKRLGFKDRNDFKCLPMSTKGDINFGTEIKKGTCSWWKGPCFLDALHAFDVPARTDRTPIQKWGNLWPKFIEDLVIVDLSIDKNPNCASTWYSRAIALLGFKKYAASFEAASKAAEHGFSALNESLSVTSLMTKGHFYRFRKDFKTAIEWFNLAKDFFTEEANSKALDVVQVVLDQTWTEWDAVKQIKPKKNSSNPFAEGSIVT